MTPLTFTVAGIPQPQGSARAFTYRRRPEKGGGIGARVDSDNPALKGWRRNVAASALVAMKTPRLLVTDAVSVVVEFYLKRPLKFGATRAPAHIIRPDVDKLARGILDALTDVIWKDDGQVVHLVVSKFYAGAGETPRAVITIRDVSQQGALSYEQKASA